MRSTFRALCHAVPRADISIAMVPERVHRFTSPELRTHRSVGEDAPDALRQKALWYLAHGVETAWLVLPESRSVEIVTATGSVEVRAGDVMQEPIALPDLHPKVADFFRQLP
jgi:hypothetical protein